MCVVKVKIAFSSDLYISIQSGCGLQLCLLLTAHVGVIATENVMRSVPVCLNDIDRHIRRSLAGRAHEHSYLFCV